MVRAGELLVATDHQHCPTFEPQGDFDSISSVKKTLPTVDNLRNFLLTPTKEMLSFLAVEISLNTNRTTTRLR
jgi:hypothetical protein